ncbi:Maltase-glucoamylase, intestinal [Armadillidium vulgare]|nr:Maltase-glucoamylase, intestinal [Armadillidium vulgare]
MIGADVCGFFDEPSEELCIRWMQLGAFSPFDRNHNTEGTADQDPAKPGWDQCPAISKSVLELRYKYIPYFYARFHRAHMNGYSVIRPLFNVFPSDITTRDINDQFMWSSDLLVAPVVEEGAVSRDVYFPDSIWYDLVSGERKSEAAGTQLIDAPLDTIPVYLRGGSILPFQNPSLTTTESRNNGFGFTVALDSNGEASGEVYWDHGYEIRDMSETFIGEVNYSEGQLSLQGQYDPTIAEGVTVENIEIFGFPSDPTGIDVNGEAADSSSWEYDETTNVLKFSLSIPLNVDFSINFKTT